jgi:hypothetical protein
VAGAFGRLVLLVTNTLFGTHPVILHAMGTGRHEPFPAWEEIQQKTFREPQRSLGSHEHLTLLTCNNGNPGMGLFERSCEHLGVPVLVGGAGIDPWVNAIHKPEVISELLGKVTTEFVAYVDSRDALLVRSPGQFLKQYWRSFPGCPLVFGADAVCYPRADVFKRYEDNLPGAKLGPFKYLNSGCWISQTELARSIFTEVLKHPPYPRFPVSDQARIRQLLPRFQGSVSLDYKCHLFQNNVCAQAFSLLRIEPESTIDSRV